MTLGEGGINALVGMRTGHMDSAAATSPNVTKIAPIVMAPASCFVFTPWAVFLRNVPNMTDPATIKARAKTITIENTTHFNSFACFVDVVSVIS